MRRLSLTALGRTVVTVAAVLFAKSYVSPAQEKVQRGKEVLTNAYKAHLVECVVLEDIDLPKGLRLADVDEDLVYVFVTPYNVQALAEVVKHFYPGADLETFEGDYGRYTFVAAHITAEELRRSRGLLGLYYSGESVKAQPDLVRQEAQIAFDWRADEPPLASPFSAQWKGTLYAPEAGPYVFETEPRGVARFYVDGFEVGEGEETRLVKGWHTLHAVCSGLEELDSLQLLWTGPGREREVVPSEFLSPEEEVNGVLVSVFEGPDFRGAPVEQSVQPVLSLLRMPTAWASAFVPQLAGERYSLEGRGQFWVEEAGSYRFDLGAWNGNASLYIDGNLVVTVAQARTLSSKSDVELTPGWHDLWLRYSYGGGEFSGVQVFWTPPGGERQVIPPRLMRPVGGLKTRPGG